MKIKGNELSYILKFNKRIQIYIFKDICSKILLGGPLGDFFEDVDFEVRVKFFEYIIISGNMAVLCPDENTYKFFVFLFKKDSDEAFKCFLFQVQIKLIEDSPKDIKVHLFTLLSDKNRTKQTLNSIKDIDLNSAEKFLFIEKKEKDSKNNNILGLSKESFQDRLKFFNSHK